MTRTRKDVIQLAILGILGLAVIFTLVLPELPTTQSQRTMVEISLFLQEVDIAMAANGRLGMEQAALDFGAELRFVTPPDDSDHRAQMTLVQRELEGGAQALIISPIDPQALAGELENIQVPVVTMESSVEGEALSIGPDNETVGVQLAQAVLADSTTGTILLVDEAGARAGVRQRLESCLQLLEEAGRTVVIYTLEEAIQVLDELDQVAIVAFDAQSTLDLAGWESSQAIYHKIYGVGGSTDVAAYLERGTLQATVAWSEYAAGYLAVQRAVESASGQVVEEVSSPTITTIRGGTIYDPDNQKLLFPVV